MRDIDIQVLIENPVDRVFEAWVKPDMLERWLTRKAVVEAAVGGAYELFWEPERPEHNSTLGCRITDIVPNSELSFNWRGPEEHEEIMGDETQVFVRLEPCEGGTLLRFVHTGWGAGAHWEKARAAIASKYGILGWLTVKASVLRRGKSGSVGLAITAAR